MATDVFIREGLNTRQMAELAQKYRNEFDVAHVELVDVIDIIEFKMPIVFPGFILRILRDAEMKEFANSEPHLQRITLKESIYNGACEGDAFSRFTIAHEIGHYLLHASRNRTLHKTPENYETPIKRMNSLESGERQADMFARHFLAPPRIARKYKDDVQLLAMRTGVPEDIAAGSIRISKRLELRHLSGIDR